jgi:hypothetical protein
VDGPLIPRPAIHAEGPEGARVERGVYPAPHAATAVALATPRETAWAFHETLVEVLRHLNQAAERRSEIDGLEFAELERTMARFWTVEFSQAKIQQAIAVLLQNGLVAEESTPAYAWDRRRVVGDRFRITPAGKSYLLRQVRASGRIR